MKTSPLFVRHDMARGVAAAMTPADATDILLPMDADAISDLFAGLGPVSIRRMFGGKGVYFEGVIIAVELRGELMLKADAELAPDFAAAGCKQWIYPNRKTGRAVAMPYWTVPDGALDDPDEMAVWARKAFEAGMRSGKQS